MPIGPSIAAPFVEKRVFQQTARNTRGTWTGVALFAIVGATAWWAFRGSAAAPTPTGPAPIPVTVAVAERQDVPHLTTSIGSVESLHSVTLRPQVEGVLTQVLFEEGQLVKQGDLLARIDDRALMANLEQARAEKARNEAELAAAQRDLARYQALSDEGAIPTQTIDQQAARVAQLQATLRGNAATLAAAEIQVSHTRIAAPLGGRVGMRRIDPGNLVRSGDTEGLVTVTQIDPIGVIFSLPQDLLPRIQPLLRADTPAAVTAYNRDAGTPLAHGRLLMIDNQIDATTGTIRLKAEFSNTHGTLWPGQFVTVQLQTGLSAQALVVAAQAVQRGLEQPFVYRLQNHGKVEAIAVHVGYQNDTVAVIDAGLMPGDRVVIDGHSRLKPGAMVKIVNDPPTTAAKAAGVR